MNDGSDASAPYRDAFRPMTKAASDDRKLLQDRLPHASQTAGVCRHQHGWPVHRNGRVCSSGCMWGTSSPSIASTEASTASPVSLKPERPPTAPSAWRAQRGRLPLQPRGKCRAWRLRLTQMFRVTVERGETRFYVGDYLLAEPSFFDVFDFPLAQGDAEAVLRKSGTVVLTHAAAQRYFGEEDPIGKTLSIEAYGPAALPAFNALAGESVRWRALDCADPHTGGGRAAEKAPLRSATPAAAGWHTR